MKKRITYIATAVLVMVLAFMLAGCGMLSDAAKLTEYTLGEDHIPSINSVVGEREVSAVESSVDNGVSTQKYTYSSASVYEDLLAYVNTLHDQGWLITKDIDLTVVPGSGQLGIQSAEEGQIVLVDFTYEDGSYTIEVKKGQGTIDVT